MLVRSHREWGVVMGLNSFESAERAIFKAVSILSSAFVTESTGLRRSKSSTVAKMSGLVKVAGIAALVSTAACSPYGSGYYNQGYGTQPSFGQSSGIPGFASGSNALGTLGGGALGGFIGNQFGRGTGNAAMTGVGVLLGGLLGNAVTQPTPPQVVPVAQQQVISGPSYGVSPGVAAGAAVAGIGLSSWEISMMHDAERRAYDAPTGSSVTWRNPQTGNGATITPVGDNYMNGTLVCRRFSLAVYVGAQTRQGQSSACKTQNGTWRTLAFADTTDAQHVADLDVGNEPAAPRFG